MIIENKPDAPQTPEKSDNMEDKMISRLRADIEGLSEEQRAMFNALVNGEEKIAAMAMATLSLPDEIREQVLA